MQKRDYKQFQDQQGVEMQHQHKEIPVGQPIQPTPYVANLPPSHGQQQFYTQPQILYNQAQPQQFSQSNFQPVQMNVPPPAPLPMQVPIIQMPIAQNYDYPITISCPCCKMAMPTLVNQEIGNTTYIWSASLMCWTCFVSPICFCCCIPFLMDSCLDKSHYCSNCGHNVLRKHQQCCDFMKC